VFDKHRCQKSMKLTTQDIYSNLVALLIGVLPLLMLTEIGHSSSAWYVLVGISLIICLTRHGGYKKHLKHSIPIAG